MKVKDLRKELEYYDDDMNVIFEVCDDFEPESKTENRNGWLSVHLDIKVKPYFISEVNGDMVIELEKAED